MSAAEEALQEGDVDEALAQAKQAVRKEPANGKHRVLLFQLQCIHGAWEAAGTQLSVCKDMVPESVPMVSMYGTALNCEALRTEIFAGKKSPHIFGKPPEWIGPLVEAVKMAGQGNNQAAAELRDQAFEAAPATSGSIDGKSFEWLADADPRLGPVLESLDNGRYFWAPFSTIRRIDIDKPEDLRDFVWLPVQIEWANSGRMVGLIPTRYPGSENNPDGLIKLGRKTAWVDVGDEQFVGQGQRMFTTDAGEDYPIMDVRKLEFDVELIDDDQADEGAEGAEDETASDASGEGTS
ncbi:MAG: hypothetical protein N2C14_29335, partial [Planctomycetales bacterium]